MSKIINNAFNEIVVLIKQSRAKVIKALNAELVDLYWNIGAYISQKIESTEWGKSVVVELAKYIQQQEPSTKGFSDKNLWRMKQFYETYKGTPKLSTLLRQISWSHNLTIFSICKTIEEKEFYLEAVDKNIKNNKENPSIGILLCKDKDNEVIKYALNRSLSPTMVSEYKMQLPNKTLLQQKMKNVLKNL